MQRCEEIARRVVGMPASTARCLAGKRRVLRLAEFDDPSNIVGAILQSDVDRVARGVH
jgi:hypothetical protein